MKALKDRITPSIVISSLALFVALGGASYAALGKNSVGSKQLKKNAVVTKKIKKNAVASSKIKKNAIVTSKIKNDAVTGAKVKESSLGTVPNATNSAAADFAKQATLAESLEGFKTFKQTRIPATSGATYSAAQAAAPEAKMFDSGPFTTYAKCITDTSTPGTYLTIYVKTTENGSAFDSGHDSLYGDPDFLNSTTPEDDRELLTISAGTDSADIDAGGHDASTFFSPSGATFEMQPEGIVKNGTLPGGNGFYGAGDVCIVSGWLTELKG
ncbi:MAG: hypothetical protein IPK93_07805 [Solirubrobacterales bacterium]|nr:hypothetical protein [Solirubrobacterales bacterium]